MSEVFLFILLTLVAFRAQRIVTADTWMPTQGFRDWLDDKAAPAHKKSRQNLWTELAELFGCPHCFGWWTALATFAVACQFTHIRWPLLQGVAAAGAISVWSELVQALEA